MIEPIRPDAPEPHEHDNLFGAGAVHASHRGAFTEAAHALFGHPYEPEDVVERLGKVHGSVTHITNETSPQDGKSASGFSLRMSHPGMGGEFHYLLYRDHDRAPTVAHLHTASIFADRYRNRGYGSRILARHIEGLRNLGVHHIDTRTMGEGDEHSGPRSEFANGYYVLPRIGFHVPLVDPRDRKFYGKMLPPGSPEPQHVHDLMSTPEGRRAWLLHGFSSDARFDLHPGSNSSLWHDEYLRSKGWK